MLFCLNNYILNSIMNEIEILTARFKDLAKKSYAANVFTFTNFLSEGDLSVFFSLEREFSLTGFKIFGGYEGAERVAIRFGNENDFGYETDFPISCLMIEPLIEKFGENLSHRDYLGALMNLGIERDLLGDILIKDKTAYVFCLDHIKDFICEKLTKVRHTNVKITVLDTLPESIKPSLIEKELVVPSERLDVIIAKLYNLSRSQSLNLFKAKKIFVNARQCESGSYACKSGDTISARGFGKFIYKGTVRTTAKGKVRVNVEIYN